MLRAVTITILVWLALGSVFFVIMMLMEFVAAITNPGHKYDLTGPTRKMSTTTFMLLWYFTWPIYAGGIMAAFMKGQTFVDFLAEGEKKKEITRKKLEAEVADVKKKIDAAEAKVRACRVIITERKYKNATVALFAREWGGSAIVTHIIHTNGSNFLCLRAMPDVAKSFPLGNTESIVEAYDMCSNDMKWAMLCTDGDDADRKYVRKAFMRSYYTYRVKRWLGWKQ